MEQSLSDATVAPFTQKPLVFASHWEAILRDATEPDFQLLTFLSDVKKMGHDVIIITSSALINDATVATKFLLKSLGRQGYDVVGEAQFKFVTQEEWKKQTLEIKKLFSPKDSSTSQSSLNKLREECFISRYEQIVTTELALALG